MLHVQAINSSYRFSGRHGLIKLNKRFVFFYCTKATAQDIIFTQLNADSLRMPISVLSLLADPDADHYRYRK